MTTGDDHSRKKARITPEQLTEMKRLYREGMSITAIAREIGCHRQTVRMHLKEKHEDVVADEVRKAVLTEELHRHFQELIQFAQIRLKSRLDASSTEKGELSSVEGRSTGPILLGGMLALPHPGSAKYMSQEWMRMYKPSPRDSYLMQSLREHTKDSPVWIYWDSWRKRVADYETSSGQLFEWLEERTEEELFERTTPERVDPIRIWLFGNIIRTASDMECEGLDGFRRNVFDPKGVIIARATDIDRDGSAALHSYLSGILKEVEQMPELASFQSATAELKSKKSQLELRRIAKEIDYALISIELMRAFPGHCFLCPV